jgi:hypothetical protein
MKSSNMRKWHRYIGIIIAAFIVLQAGSGLLLTVSEFGGTHDHSSEAQEHESDSVWHAVIGWIHYDSNPLMGIYRILLGAGILVQTTIGAMIFFDIRHRVKSKGS